MCRVREAVAVMGAELKSLADLNPVFMPLADKAAALLDLAVLETQVVELRLRVMASSGDVAEAEGFRSIGPWLAHHAHVRRSDAAADERLARSLDRDRPVLASAVREGRVSIPQARVIAGSVDELPTRVGQEVVERAEVELVRLAAEHDPSDLAKLGRTILQVVDPDRFEDEERRRLEDAERHAWERQRLRWRAMGDGTTRISGVVPDAVAARLATYLHAFTNPRLPDGTARAGLDDPGPAEVQGFGRSVTRPRQMAEAFGQLLECIDPKHLPLHGGDATHVVVTIPLETLKTDAGAAVIANEVPGDGFETITAAEARRLACTARIIPAVLGKDSEVLDLGRGARLFSKGQRRALALRDRTCRAEGCSIPGTWSEAHHLVPWSRGGPTDLGNAALLCAKHHHRAHDPGYAMSRLASGDFRFHRRT